MPAKDSAETRKAPRLIGGPPRKLCTIASPGQDGMAPCPIRRLLAEVVELTVSCAAQKGVPFARGELEHGPGGVLGVAHADPATGQAGDLDAVAVGKAQRALDPGQTGTFHVLYLLKSLGCSRGWLRKVGYRLHSVCAVKTENTADL